MEVPRLGDRGAQRRHAVRPVHHRADRRRHAAERDRSISGSPAGSIATRSSTRKAASTSRRRAGRRCSTASTRRPPCGWDRPSPARSATTTSTTRSRSATTTACSRSSTTSSTRSSASPGSDHWIQEPTLDLPSPEQAARRDALTAGTGHAQRDAHRAWRRGRRRAGRLGGRATRTVVGLDDADAVAGARTAPRR